MASVPPTIDASDISPISIVDEMKSSYLDYAMSVIVARALPDVRDGLKPVHRRILYASQEGGFVPGKPYRKSAKIVGDVMGNYHPHGDSSIYMALARMAQDWAMRVMLIDGQGNFGSMDPDMPASMRYTEARLSKPAMALLQDIEKDTVDFGPNYDGSLQEPLVLPARFPNLLVNGAGGIAVGMATNIPPHNLGEVIAACKAFIANRAITVDELHEIIPGPDFPTGALILGKGGARNAYHTGKGSIIMRSRHVIEEGRGDKRAIVLTEIPYQLGKNGLVESIAEAAKDKRIEGVTDIRDESSRHGVRIVIELRRDATPDVVLNQLWRHTQAQTSFPANMLAIRGGRPEVLSLRDIIEAFVKFREEVITRRSKFELLKARERAHILLGLVVAVTNLDEVVRIIRGSPNPAEARAALSAREWPIAEIAPYIRLVEAVELAPEGDSYRLSDLQVRAILELRLHRLTGLGRDEIGNELAGLATTIAELLEILGNRARLYEILVEELDKVAADFATPRRSEITAAGDEIDDEDLIEREEMVVTVTHGGYIKRTPLDAFRTQARGGKGRSGMATKDEDAVVKLFVTSTHTPVLFFSTAGKVYRKKVWRLPEGAPARARPADDQSSPACRRRDDLDRAAAARGRIDLERSAHPVRHRQGSGPAQQHGPVHPHPDRGQDRDALFRKRQRRRGGRGDHRSADRRHAAQRRRRRPARHAQRQGDPLPRDGRPRIPEPDVRRRARRPPARRRRGHLAVDPARHAVGSGHRDARGLSARRALETAPRTSAIPPRPCPPS